MILILTLGFILAANCPPSIPKTYSGFVFYEDLLLKGSYEIRATMSGSTIGIGEVLNGEYEIDISPCFGSSGELSFSINNIATNENGYYTGQEDWGVGEKLNLSVGEKPDEETTCGNTIIDLGEECDRINLAGRTSCGNGFIGTISCDTFCLIDYSNCSLAKETCGDGICNNGETCSSCLQDCGTCSSGGNSGGSGGSSGSKIISTIKTPTDKNTENKNPIKITSQINTEQDRKKSFGITGSVIGFIKTKTGLGVIFATMILICGTIIIFLQLKKTTKKNE